MSKEEIENGNPNQIFETVNEILDFNKKIQEQRGLGSKNNYVKQKTKRKSMS